MCVYVTFTDEDEDYDVGAQHDQGLEQVNTNIHTQTQPLPATLA